MHLHITKGIPVAGGMAGGSADAAAALVACDALWGTALPRAELAGLAAGLGSDVPFALVGGTALGTGRGERLDAGAGPRHVPVGAGAGRRAGCPPRRCTPSATGCAARPRAARAAGRRRR